MAKNKAKMNKFLTGAITATMVATAVAPIASAAAFTDLDRVDESVKAEIDKAVDLGFFKDAEKFNPAGTINRSQAAFTLARYIAGGTADTAALKAYVEANNLEQEGVAPFGDVPLSYKNGNEHQEELYYAALIVKDAGSFTQKDLNPTGPVTRSQMAKIIAGAFGLNKADDFESKITDINHLDTETKEFIETIASHGVTNVTTFNPAGTVTRSQMASFLVRANDAVQEDVDVLKVESVSAIGDTKVAVTFNGNAPSDLKAEDFKVTDKTVTGVAVSGKVATLTVNSAFVDGREYTVTYDETSKTFKYEVGDVKSVDFSTTTFQANVGLNLEDSIVVRDDQNQLVSQEDYQITGIESSDTSVINKNGEFLKAGTSKVRVNVTFKNGETKWSEWTTIQVNGVTVGKTVGWTLVADSKAPIADNSAAFNVASATGTNFMYADALKLATNPVTEGYYLNLFKNFDSGDAMPRHIDLRDDSVDEVKVELLGNTNTLISVVRSADGILVKPINEEVNGTATLKISGEIDGKAFTENITFEVKPAREFTKFKTQSKITLLDSDKAGLAGAITDLDATHAFGATTEDGIDTKTLEFASLVLDQYDKTGALTIDSVDDINAASGEWIIETKDRLGNEAGYVKVSVPKAVADVVSISKVNDATLGDITITSDKAVAEFSLTLTYFAKDTDQTKKTETKIPVEIKETDGVVKGYNVTPVQTTIDSKYDTVDLNADGVLDDRTEFVVSLLDKNGLVLTNNVAPVLLDIELDPAKNHTDDERHFLASNQAGTYSAFTFANTAKNYWGETGSTVVKYSLETTENAADSLFTDTVTINYKNSNPVPLKAGLVSSMTVDLSDYAGTATLKDVLLGLIEPQELNLDEVQANLGLGAKPNPEVIAPKVGFDGYKHGFTPAISFTGVDNKSVNFGPAVSGVTLPGGNVRNNHVLVLDYAGTGIDNKQEFVIGNVNYVNVANAKGIKVNGTALTTSINELTGALTDTIELDTGVEKATFTLEVESVTLAGDTRGTDKNLLGGKKLVTFTIVK